MAITAQDRKILEEVYKCRGLLLEHIWMLFMPGNSRWAAYKRINRLEDSGYIRKVPYVERGRKAGTFIYLADAGLREVGEVRGRSRDLIDPRMHQVWAALGEIYVALKPYGWDYLEGRLAKKKYGLNRNAKLHGLLRAGHNYGVYLVLSKEPRAKTLRGIQKDIAHCCRYGLSSFLLFYESEAVPEYFSGSTHGAYRLFLLPYPEGVKRVAHFLTPGALEKWFSLLVPPVEGFRKVAETFAEYLVKQGSREHYVTELVSNDVAKQYHLEQYGYGRAKETGRGVYIFVLEGTEGKWREKYPEKHYPHFRFIPVSLEGAQ